MTMIENLYDNGINVKQILKYLFLIVFCLVLVILFVFNSIFIKKYVIVDESLVLIRNGNKWVKADKFDDINDYNYSIVGDFGIKNDVLINYDLKKGAWYYSDKNYSDLNVNNVFVAYTDKFKKIKVADSDFSYYDGNDDELLEMVLGDRDIDIFKDSVMKNSFDLDGDGKIETIYTLTNESSNNFNGARFSRIFGTSDGKFISKLDDDVKNVYIVRSIIDLDGDGKYEVIVSKGSTDVATPSTCFQIYSYKKNKFTRIMDCK